VNGERSVGDALFVEPEPTEEAEVIHLESPDQTYGPGREVGPCQVGDAVPDNPVEVQAGLGSEASDDPDSALRQARSDAQRAELEAVTAKARADIARSRAEEAEALARLRLMDRQQAQEDLDGGHLEAAQGTSSATANVLLATSDAPEAKPPAPAEALARLRVMDRQQARENLGGGHLEAAQGTSSATANVLLTTSDAPEPEPPAQPPGPALAPAEASLPSTAEEALSADHGVPSTEADARLATTAGTTTVPATEQREPDTWGWGRHRPARSHRSASARGTARNRGPRAVRAALVVAVVASVAFATTAGFGWAGRNGDGAQISAARSDVVLAATQDITILNTLDYSSVDAGLASWLGATTGALHDGLSTTSAADRSALAAAKDVTTATVLDVAVVQLDRQKGTAAVIASVQIVVKPTTGAATTKRERLQGSMTRVAGEWKLSALAPVGLSF
jgi:Mce-associated membrane protein